MELLFLPRLRHCLLLRRLFRRRLFLGVRLRQLSSSTSASNSASECEGETVAEAPFGYDPNLKLVAGLSGPVDADDVAMERPPFRLDGVEKKDYLHLYDEQLRFEETNFTAVRNLARRSREKSMEELIEEWEWQAEIEQNLFAALEKTRKWTVRACLKQSLVRECSRQLVKLTHAILCRGQHAIPTTELNDFLGRVVLLLNQTAFNESIAMGSLDNKKKLNDLFDQYIDYFLDADIARKCSIREWWYSCAAQLGINPRVYPDIELFNVPNEVIDDAG
ncbi:hypothetical protein niasHS_003274 [Heterodera schachtii]|uniref:Uncharacterized protein n=1 Tax=Heterodera schachtii TaxID=97005 RepID=A0ABD2KG06_HETSC